MSRWLINRENASDGTVVRPISVRTGFGRLTAHGYSLHGNITERNNKHNFEHVSPQPQRQRGYSERKLKNRAHVVTLGVRGGQHYAGTTTMARADCGRWQARAAISEQANAS